MIDYNRISAEYKPLYERAEKLRRSMIERARATCIEAGLDGRLLGIHPHNAMCGLHYGKPWKGVDYSLVRRTLWLVEKSYEPHRILGKWYDKQMGIKR